MLAMMHLANNARERSGNVIADPFPNLAADLGDEEGRARDAALFTGTRSYHFIVKLAAGNLRIASPCSAVTFTFWPVTLA